MAKEEELPEGTLVYTDHQLSGRGQRGNVWLDHAGKNLLTSILLQPKFLPVQKQFLLNLVAGLAIVQSIEKLCSTLKPQLKWPNDVFIGDRKVAGVLIENTIKGRTLDTSVVGIGINVNQTDFRLHTATSVLLDHGELIDREVLLEELLLALEGWYLKLKAGGESEILSAYHRLLRWQGEMHLFKTGSDVFNGVIKGIDEVGRLVISEGDIVRKFNIKEVEFIT